uniref:Receptor ligand binding region domain-containing protein n=1 Tax=Panagrolaimus sp. JU765 TaxID=591449 RepID=A0AC34QVW0_9BILA
MRLRHNPEKYKFCQICLVTFVVWLQFLPLIRASTAAKAWRHAGRREVWPLAVSEPEPGISDLGDDDDLEFSVNTAPRKERQLAFTRRPIYEVSKRKPIYILFPLPEQPGYKELNPFGITIGKTRPVVDEAIEEVYRRHLVPEGSLDIAFEDTKLSDAVGPNVAIHALVKNKLDCIIGYAFVYSLAPVARMSPHWQDSDSHGIPIITSVGLTANLDNRREYQLMTRISSPYKIVKDAVVSLWKFFNWTRDAVRGVLLDDGQFGAVLDQVPTHGAQLLHVQRSALQC